MRIVATLNPSDVNCTELSQGVPKTGPNFTEMYNFLRIENIAFEVKSEKELIEQLEKKIETPQNININEKIVKVGNEILLSTIKKLDQYIVN